MEEKGEDAAGERGSAHWGQRAPPDPCAGAGRSESTELRAPADPRRRGRGPKQRARPEQQRTSEGDRWRHHLKNMLRVCRAGTGARSGDYCGGPSKPSTHLEPTSTWTGEGAGSLIPCSPTQEPRCPSEASDHRLVHPGHGIPPAREGVKGWYVQHVRRSRLTRSVHRAAPQLGAWGRVVPGRWRRRTCALALLLLQRECGESSWYLSGELE